METQNNISQDRTWREFVTILSTCKLSLLLFYSVKNDLISYIEINLDIQLIKILVLTIPTFVTDFDMSYSEYMSENKYK